MARAESHVRKTPIIEMVDRPFKRMIQVIQSPIMIQSIIALLLGRAIILNTISPFAVAYVAAMSIIFPKNRMLVFFCMIIGGYSHSFEQASYLALALLLFYSLQYLAHREKSEQKFLYIFTFFSIAIARVFFYSIPSPITVYDSLQILLECTMGIVLLFIFMQALPIIFQRQITIYVMQTEQFICLSILVASVITGLIGISLYDMELEHIFARLIVLIFAFTGGAPIGAAVGVVVGIVLALAKISNIYQISLLAFSGLLGGMFKEWHKQGVGLGLLAGTLLLGMYDGMDTLLATIVTSIISTCIFFFIPRHVLQRIAKHIPGSFEYHAEEKRYMKKIRDVTADRVERFSVVFSALANSFLIPSPEEQQKHAENETDNYLSSVTKKTCNHCFMKKHCWQKNFQYTYDLLGEMKEQLVEYESIDRDVLHAFKNHCVKSHQVVEILQSEAESTRMNRQLKRQVAASKRIVAEQLQGVSDVMGKFAEEMAKERIVHEQLEMEMTMALKKFHIPIHSLEAYSLEKGNIDIEMDCLMANEHGEAEKLIAPILTNILEEEIVLEGATISQVMNIPSRFTFRSSKRYVVETGVATAAKDGGLVSGDSYSVVEISKGKFTIAISDGMGNGKRANEESSETIRLLKKMLETGMSERVAIQSVNSILTLRTTDEIFSTLDLAIFNLYHAHVRFLKVSAMPSFIKRGEDVWQISANNLPMGMIEHVELDAVTEQLKPGDIVVLVSDGVFNRTVDHETQERLLKELIGRMKTNKPQEIADILLEEMVRYGNGVIADDMTIVVAKMKRHIPKWSAIEVNKCVAK